MTFWVAILAGALCAWFAFKRGFYDTLAMLFNIVVAIYVAIFLAPVIIDLIPAAGEISAGNVLTLLAIAAGIFFILHGISYTFITGQFNVSFPKLFDIVFAPLLGFLAGFLLLSLAAFLICVTPISQNRFAGKIGLNRYSQQANISYLCWWCDLVHSVTSSEDGPQSTEQAIEWYFHRPEKKTGEESIEHAEPSESPDVNVPTPFNTRTNDELLSEIDNDAGQY